MRFTYTQIIRHRSVPLTLNSTRQEAASSYIPRNSFLCQEKLHLNLFHIKFATTLDVLYPNETFYRNVFNIFILMH